PEGAPLTCSLTRAPQGMSLNGCTVQWTPTAAAANVPVALRVSDGQAYAEQSWQITVTAAAPTPTPTPPANQPPRITSTPPAQAQVGSAYSYALQATDPEGAPLTCSLTRAPQGMSLNGCTVQWT
ncbi:hypothetical protein, partial [Ottowia cancrivicina]